MKSRVKQLLRSALGPALRWIRVQLDVIDRRVAAVQERQEDLVRAQEAVLEAHDAEIEVVGRQLSQQRVALEALERRQAELVAEVRELRAQLPVGAPRATVVD